MSRPPGDERFFRGVETGLAWSVLGVLLIYAPVEIHYSEYAFSDPMLVVDLIAMALLGFGAVHSLRARPRPAPGPLCGALGFSFCLAWRSFFWRAQQQELVEQGLMTLDPSLQEPPTVLPAVGVALGVAAVAFGLSLRLAARRPEPGETGRGTERGGRMKLPPPRR